MVMLQSAFYIILKWYWLFSQLGEDYENVNFFWFWLHASTSIYRRQRMSCKKYLDYKTKKKITSIESQSIYALKSFQ